MTDEVRITWHASTVSRDDRERQRGQRGCVLWFTGLSGCGKSTIANLVDQDLHRRGNHSYLLDGDNVRHGLNASPELLTATHDDSFAERFGLTFAPEDRQENIRRISEVAKLFCDAGLIALTAFVSPYRRDRDAARVAIGDEDFIEVFVDAPLELCEQRDPKGLYRRARAGKLSGMTGIDAPYESPLNPELVLNSGGVEAPLLALQVVEYLQQTGRIQ